ncbi:MAG TPA: prolyl oligopeptidase family serine peptidase, partial [Myxococcales bacterium]|nr:prolyl oligopeptidase family serine peptidase [Myxococcales bacterium]
MKKLLIVLALAACTGARSGTLRQLEPPVAKKVPHSTTLHGETLPDDYAWLREKGAPQVVQYLHAEAAYADAFMQPTQGLQRQLYQEMLSRVQETDSTAPFAKDGYWYYTRTEKGKQYLILARRKASLDAPEQVLLDVNQLAEGRKFMQLGAWDVSDDGNLLAYTTDETGFRQYDLHVRDLRSSKDGAEKIARVDTIAWSRDSRYLLYVVEDPVAKRAYQLYRHAIGAAKDDLIYEDPDERFSVEVRRSRSRDFVFVTSGSHTTTEVRFLPASDPFATPALVQAREPGHEYYVDHRGGLFYIRSNSTGRNFHLVTAPVSAPRKENWTEVLPHREDVMLLDVDLFANHLVRHEREGGLPQIVVRNLRTGQERKLPVPEPDYELRPFHNEDWDPPALRIEYQSPVTPKSEYDVDFASAEWKLIKRDPVPNYDPGRYEVERVWSTVRDGTRIPVAVVHAKGAARDGQAPLLLYAYGSYGYSYPDTFESRRFSLIDRGVTYAIAHIRGGGELGKKWHDQGRMMNKMNTFTDFI